MSEFQDSSTDCAICLEPLHERRTLTLSCGHVWHYDCLVQQLQQARPSSTSRLLFTGCQCAKCGVICEHEALEDLTRTTDALRARVDELVEEQLSLDAPQVFQKAKENPQQFRSLIDEARRKYAFYMCNHCKEPYFGGTVECAELEQPNDEERLCVACVPQIVCRNPLQHNVVWKCRYCCQPSTYVCYGNVHFCDSCHERNSERVRRGDQEPIPAIPCIGEECQFPKSSEYHSNGATKDCEQVYWCAYCEPSVATGNDTLPPGSRNLLRNPSGAQGLEGWQQLSRIPWQVETSDFPFNAEMTTNFVCSFQTSCMVQILNLSQVLQPNLTAATMEVAAHYRGRTDCPSIFRLEAHMLDRNRTVLSKESSRVLDAPADGWERVSLTVNITDPVKYLAVVVIGQDRRFWQGNFGSKVTNISVRVLGTPQQVESMVLSANEVSGTRTLFLDRFNGDLLRGALPLILLLAWIMYQQG